MQTALDTLVDFSTIEVGYGVKRYGGIRQAILWAQNFTPGVPEDDIPFYHTIQVQAENDIESGQLENPVFRHPTRNEIFVQANLAMCYGAKGIMYFLIMTSTPNQSSSGRASYGLFETHGQFGDIIQDPADIQCRNSKYNYVKELNNDISLIEDELLTLTWIDAFSLHQDQIQSEYIEQVSSYDLGGTPDPPDETFVELGLFKKTTEFSSNILDYFMLVNRRGLETESRDIFVDYNNTLGTQYVNWSVIDIATGDYWSGLADNSFTVRLEPGKGKLFSLESTVIGGGSLFYDEVIQSDIELKRDLVIESGITLTVNTDYHCYGNIIMKDGAQLKTTENGKLNFYNGKKIEVEGSSTCLIYSSSANKLELDFTAPHHTNGINVKPDGSLVIFDCVVKNARVGVTVNSGASWFEVNNVDFENCLDICINVTGPLFASSIINGNTFLNPNFAIYIVNVDDIYIMENVIQNSNAGIYLSNVTNPEIINNAITSTLNTMPGIFLESCSGIIRGNFISGHTNGIHLGNSSPDIGGNEITNNLYHGIYIGIGSLPNMEASLYQNPPIFYALSGYNDIIENGGTTTGGPPDNDGSEIYFYSSNALMSKGCNNICDDRSPGGERPPYNTKLLMNGSSLGGQIEVYAERNYWCDNSLYPLEERFGDLIVYYEPELIEPCPFPQGGGSGEEMLLTTSGGEVIDTIYSIDREVGTITNTELLYASAEGKFIYSEYDEAEADYNQIVSGNEPIDVKLKAYQRLYEIGKLNSKPVSYFNSLYNEYSSLSQSAEDSLTAKILTQLGSLSLIGGEEIIPAVEEFDYIVQNNSGSEEAIYAEIDALTAALLIQGGDSTLSKSTAANYVLDNNGYYTRVTDILIKNFGAEIFAQEEELLPKEYTLYQNYPNPFNPVTTIKYDLPNNGNVSLIVYDILGRKVKTLINRNQNPGRHEVSWDASSVASGIYIYQLRASDYVDTKKMILLK